jgi:O-antigen ligase
MRIVFTVLVFIGGSVGTIENATSTMRIACGSVIILVLLRYQYALLLAWACINVFIGSSLPFFNGNNLLSGLTFPTLLLLFLLPTKEAFKRMPALPFWLAYFVWMLLSIGISPIPLQTFLINWTSELDFFAVSVLVILLIDSRKKLIGFLDAMIAPAIFIALYGLWGFIVQQHGVIDTTTGFFRISSIFMDTPPTLGLYLSILIPITIYRLFMLRGFFKCSAGIAVLLLLLLALGLTFDRGTLLAVSLGLIITVLLLPSREMKSIVIGAGTILIGLIFLGTTLANVPLLSRFANSDIGSLNGRTYLWQAIIDHFDPSQILGNGMQSSDVLLTNLRVGFGGNVIATAAHNIYLEAMYEHGIVGLTLLLLAFGTMGYGSLRKYKTGSDEQKLLLAIAFGTFISILIQGYESNDIWNQGVGIYFFIFISLPFARTLDKTQRRNPVAPQQFEEAQYHYKKDNVLTETEELTAV